MYMFNVIVCSLLVVATFAYDFQDSYYNEILKVDLDDNADIGDEFLNYRVTRDTEIIDDKNKKGCRRGHKSCCGDQDDNKTHEQFRDLKRQCFAETRKSRSDDGPVDLFSCDKINKTKAELLCVMQCVGQKQNVIDDKGDIITDKLISFIKTELATSDWQKIVADSVMSKCVEEAKAEAIKPRTTECNPSSMKLSHCLWREFQLACPKELIKETKQCQRMREKLLKKESPFPAPITLED